MQKQKNKAIPTDLPNKHIKDCLSLPFCYWKLTHTSGSWPSVTSSVSMHEDDMDLFTITLISDLVLWDLYCKAGWQKSNTIAQQLHEAVHSNLWQIYNWMNLFILTDTSKDKTAEG